MKLHWIKLGEVFHYDLLWSSSAELSIDLNDNEKKTLNFSINFFVLPSLMPLDYIQYVCFIFYDHFKAKTYVVEQNF